MRMKFKPTVASLLAVMMIALSLGRAEAMLAPATTPAAAAARAQDIQTVQTFLEQQQVGRHLSSMGLSASQVESRLDNLSDQELHQVATRIQREHPAGDAVIYILVVGILVLLFVYLLKRV